MINMSPCLWVTDVLFTQNFKSKWVLGVMYLGIKECILGAFGSIFMHRYLPKEKFKYNREKNTGSVRHHVQRAFRKQAANHTRNF